MPGPLGLHSQEVPTPTHSEQAISMPVKTTLALLAIMPSLWDQFAKYHLVFACCGLL